MFSTTEMVLEKEFSNSKFWPILMGANQRNIATYTVAFTAAAEVLKPKNILNLLLKQKQINESWLFLLSLSPAVSFMRHSASAFGFAVSSLSSFYLHWSISHSFALCDLLKCHGIGPIVSKVTAQRGNACGWSWMSKTTFFVSDKPTCGPSPKSSTSSRVGSH